MNSSTFPFEQVEEIAAAAWGSPEERIQAGRFGRLLEQMHGEVRLGRWQQRLPGLEDPLPTEILRGFSRRLASIEERVAAIQRHLKSHTPSVVASEVSTIPGLVLRRPIPVVVEDDGDEVAVRWIETGLAGFGHNEHEALEGLRDEVAEVYQDLKDAAPESLGERVLVIREVLRAYVTPSEDVYGQTDHERV